MTDSCITYNQFERKLFLPTSAGCSASVNDCGSVCETTDSALNLSGPNAAKWISRLLMNMLGTDGRKEQTPCGFAPGGQGGHWSESFLQDDTSSVGTIVRDIPAVGTIDELTGLLGAYIKETVDRLVDRGIARSVEVETTYVGGLRFNVDVVVYGVSDQRVNVSIATTKLSNGWIWNDM